MDESGVINTGRIVAFLQTQGINLLNGLIVLAVGFFLAHWFFKIIGRKQALIRIEPTLRGFLDNLIRLVVYLVIILTAVSVMGIPMTSVVTLLASAGVAVSLAMQGALSNLVGGLLMLMLKPIKAGDYVKINDVEGTVKSIGVFYTEMATYDNRHISLPNSTLTNTAIVNFTREGTRRLDVKFAVSYRSDIDLVKHTLEGVIARNPAILEDPAPSVVLNECGESSLNFVIRVWCRVADYWDINFYLIEQGKRALDAAGVEIPYPQMDVHVK